MTENVVAISDTVVPDRDWVFASYTQNVIMKCERISQNVVVWKSVYVICFYVVPLNKFPIRGYKGEYNYSFLHNRSMTGARHHKIYLNCKE